MIYMYSLTMTQSLKFTLYTPDFNNWAYRESSIIIQDIKI